MSGLLWQKRPGEPPPCYHAFTHYRDMGPGRTVDGAYRTHRVGCRKLPANDRVEAPGLWRKWKATFNWAERVDAYDASVEEDTRRKRLQSVLDMNEKHAAIAAAMLGKVIQRLQALDVSAMSPATLALWVDRATMVERRARGEATDYVRTDHGGAVSVEHGFSARIMGSPAGVRAATELLALLAGTADAPGDPGGDGVAGE